jgi:O-antigen ligase
MSIVTIAVYAFVPVVLVYSFKDWFKGLCGLVLLMAVIGHAGMPKNMLGIQGLNLWNVLFIVIGIAWLANRHSEKPLWDMPRNVGVLLLLYLGVILVGFGRTVLDRSNIQDYPIKNLISEELINTIKWILPGILLFDGCRTRRRLIWAIVSLLTMYVLVAVQVTREMPSDSVLRDNNFLVELRREVQSTGYNADNASTMLAGAFWGMLAALPLTSRRHHRALVMAAAGVIIFGQALTGGRAGYIAWGCIGLALCLLKWRKQLILAPVVLLLLSQIFPGAARLMRLGFGEIDASGQSTVNDSALTSGRNLIWPPVLGKIRESPIIGYGRLAMKRTGLTAYTEHIFGEGEGIGHPHNMYLETLLDNGILGSLPIFLLWGTMLTYSARLFKSSNRLYAAVGGLTLSVMLAQLVAGLGSQHVYPKEETFGMWMAMFLTIRVHVEEKHARANMIGAECYRSSRVLSENQGTAVPIRA